MVDIVPYGDLNIVNTRLERMSTFFKDITMFVSKPKIRPRCLTFQDDRGELIFLNKIKGCYCAVCNFNCCSGTFIHCKTPFYFAV